ncbi:MAG: LytTR family transcriptional regulator DNA-binding domain-containing protein, partial [Lachnospiraceae bacterium]|nr:LytTR family transcriptional regulator DNA-binding domain-containing protein [Lachnospiraceae bacterium]
VLLSPSDIYYVESSARFPHYVTKNGLLIGLMLTTSFREEMTGLLTEPFFFLCGASFLINLAYVKSVEKDGILFQNGKRLTLPRAPLKGLRIAWTNYWLDN